jgi:hypothetical protein
MPKTATKRPMTLAEYKAKNEKANKDTRSPVAKAVGWDANKTQFIRDLLTGGNDVAGRGMIAGMLGAPGDIAGLAENSLRGLIGKPQVQPWGGSEHIGQTLEQAGLVSDVRRPKTELLASLISPASAAKTVLNAPKTAMTALRALDNLDSAPTMARMGQRGAVDVSKYGMSHRPMTKESGAATLDDLVPSFGEDVYTRNALQYFGSGDPREAQVLRTLSRLRGNPDAEVTIYRGAPSDAESINAGDWVTLHPSVAQDYAEMFDGGRVLTHKVPASHVTAWPDALLEQGYYPPVTAPQPGLLGKMVAPQDEALRVAQANAAKPVSEGGLGLRPDNTPEERAAAMGFDTPAFHGTRSVFDTFDPSKATASRQGSGTWFSTNPEIANTYAGNGGSVIPALINKARFGEIDTAGANWQKIPSDTVIRHANDTDSQLSEYIDSVFDDYGDTNLAANISRRSGDKGLVVYNSNDRGGYGGGVDFDNLPDSADNITVFDPRYVRSRFAAFDPMRRDSTDMLAGFAPLGLVPWLPQDDR